MAKSVTPACTAGQPFGAGSVWRARRDRRVVWKTVLVVALLTLPVVSASAATDDIAEDRLKQAQESMTQVREQLDTAVAALDSASMELEEAEALFARMEEIVNEISSAVRRQQRQMVTAQARLDSIETEHRRLAAAMQRQAIEIYKRGAAHRIEALLRSSGVPQAAARDAYMSVVTESGRVTVEVLNASRLALEAEQERFDGERQRLERLQSGQQQVFDEVAELRNHRLLAAAQAEERARDLQRRLDDLEDEEAAMLDLIRTRQLEARERAAVRQQAVARGAGPDEIADEVARIRPVSDAGYAWPMCVPVTSEYGARWGRLHRGVDQPASPGVRVHAVKDGSVMFADWYGGFGRLVLIDHHDGVVSAYAHLSRFTVAEGAEVVRGQTIGGVGSTGFSTGPHLHLELRVSGQAVDPRRLLPSRKC